MKLREVEQYAKDNLVSDCGKFEFTNLKGEIIQFQLIDAYMGIFIQEGVGSKGFITVNSWLKEVGDNFDFRIIE
jgi:hypothetical protein